MVAGRIERGDHIVDRTGPSLLFPDRIDRAVDQAPLGVVQPVDVTCHLVHDGLQHRHAVEQIVLVLPCQLLVDHAEGVETEARRHGELDEGAALQLGRVLERAAIVDHDDTRAGAAQRRAQFLERHRLARPGLADDGDIMVARLVLEGTPEIGLAAPPDQHQMRNLAPQKLTLDRREIGGRRGQQRAHPFHALEVARKPIRHRHGHRAEQPHDLQISIVEKVPARSPVDRLQHPLVGIAPALGREGSDAEEYADELAALADFVIHIAPFLALVLELREETRGLGIGEARRSHELEARLVARGHRVGKFDAEVGRDRTGHPQLIGEHVADQARDVPRRPARRQVADRKGADVENVGQDLADLRCFVDRLAGGAEALGPQQHAVGLDMQLDVAADGLVGDGIKRIVADDILAGRGRGRGDVVDPGDQRRRVHLTGRDVDRRQRRDEAVHDRHDLLGRDARGFGRRIGDRDPVVAQRKGRIGRQRFPDPVGQEIDPVLGHPLVDAACRIARQIPFRETLADPRAHPLVELQAAGRGDRFRQELREDLTRPLISTNERRRLDHETPRGAVVKDPGFGIIASIGQPVREHRDTEFRPFGVRPLGVAKYPGKQAFEDAPRHLTYPPGRQRGSSRPSRSERSRRVRPALPTARRRHPARPSRPRSRPPGNGDRP